MAKAEENLWQGYHYRIYEKNICQNTRSQVFKVLRDTFQKRTRGVQLLA